MPDGDLTDVFIRVKIHSLQGSTQLNGRTGVVSGRSLSLLLDEEQPVGAVSSSDEGGGRVCVQLDGRQLLIRRGNLSLVTHASPRPMRRLQEAVANTVRSPGRSGRRSRSPGNGDCNSPEPIASILPLAGALDEDMPISPPKRRPQRGRNSHVTFSPIDICVPVDKLAQDADPVTGLGACQRSRYHTRVFLGTRSEGESIATQQSPQQPQAAVQPPPAPTAACG